MSTVSIDERTGTVIPPGDGRTTWVAGHPITHKLTAEQTGGAFSLFESSVPPGNGAPPHLHHTMDETYYILDGTFEFHLGTNVLTGRPGVCLHIPRGSLHSYKNVGTTWGRLLTIASPSGIEDGYVDLSNLDLNDPDCQTKVRSVCEKHAMEIQATQDEDTLFF